MKCDPGFHTYRPFPRTFTLYCSSCGDIADDKAVRTPASIAAPAPEQDSPEQQELPLRDDPDAGIAREIIASQRAQRAEARARDHLENEVRRIVGESSGLTSEQAEELVRDAMNFGPELDLDKFAGLVEAHAVNDRREGGAEDNIPD